MAKNKTLDLFTEEQTGEKTVFVNQNWQILFTASTRLHFLQIFLLWKKKGGTALPEEGMKIAYMADGKMLYYYDFQNCHQYSKVMLQRLCDNSIERLEKDYQRYVRMLANDNNVVGKILTRSVGRKVKWRGKVNKNVEKSYVEALFHETDI
jgi:hypothetical protein